MEIYTLEDILKCSDYQDNPTQRKRIKELLCDLQVYDIYKLLFQKRNDYNFTDKGKAFVLQLISFYTSPAGVEIRKRNLKEVSKYKLALVALLNSFDEAIPKDKPEYKTWYHNTFYYKEFIIKERIEKMMLELADSPHILEAVSNIYYLSATQQESLIQDMTIQKVAFEKEGINFVLELEEVAYKALNECADIFNTQSATVDVMQLIDNNEYESDEKYRAILKEIDERNRKKEKNLTEFAQLDKKQKQLEKIKDTYFKKELEILNNKDISLIFNKYISHGKLLENSDTSEEGFIAHYGITNYSKLKQKVLETNHFMLIK